VRILVCGINYAPDLVGIAKFNAEFCEALSANGHEVRVVTAPPYYPAWRVPSGHRRWLYCSEQRNGVDITRAPIYIPQRPAGLNRLFHHASFALSSAPPVISMALRWRPQLMISVAPSLMSSAVVAMAARRAGAVSWLHLQDFEIDAAFGLGLLKNEHGRLQNSMLKIERRILRAFDRVSSIAPRMLDRLADKGVERRRLHEFRNWVDTDVVVPGGRMTGIRAELGLRESDIVALYSGSMSNKQGLELIIAAARLLKPICPQVTFIMCGDGPRRPTLEAEAADLGNVRFLGLQPDDRFAELLNTADLHLIPQRAEAADLVLPSKIGGILASGRPVVVMAAPGTGLAKEIEGYGLVVTPGDPQALAAAVRKLADHEDIRSLLGANARRRALERWNKAAILRALEREFVAVCGQVEQSCEPQHSPLRS
jgi:colanic acid biosynthesis glycosyl transferase WcaI